MALNIRLTVASGDGFNHAVSSTVDNRIQLGDRGALASLASGSNLEGNVGAAALAAGAASGAGGHRRLASLEPTAAGGASPSPARAPMGGADPDTDAAIRDAAGASGIDVDTMRGMASIESSMNPGSNRGRGTQYKGLYQLGRDEWRRYGSGDIYDAHDNAMAAARLFAAHKAAFRARFGREPTDPELYMMHQQGEGFYTRGAMTNIAGNPYPGMHGPQSPASFEAGWGRELERRKEMFARRGDGKPAKITLGDIAALSKK